MLQIILSSIIRSVFAYLLLLTVTRFMGRKAISQMTFFDLTVIVTLGSVTGNLGIGNDRTVTNIATVVVAFGAFAIITGYLNIKSKWVRKITNSEPVTAIANGKIIDKNLKKLRFTMNELTAMLRDKNVFNIADVEFAIMESYGQLSVLPKSQKAPLTPSDLNIPTNYRGLTKDIIIDGKILKENLEAANISESWLRTQLANQGISIIDQVFYAGLDSANTLYVSKKQNKPESHGQYGIE